MGRIFAFVTFLCLTTMIIMGLASPNDPLFLFASNGIVAILARTMVAGLMFSLAFSPILDNPKLRSYSGLAGFVLITFGIMVLAGTGGGGIYPYLQPADLLSAVIVGVTLSVSTL